ncbi:hypothetical protein IQ07DRAFT_614102 [Pyrenochaeta sp. DS3sAY3a]|nr:hypothetical protein IQ07DRAFT_614102 [Pyrenochaeta sp. DS3sAY3a]
MARSDGSSSGADLPPSKFEIKTIAINISIKIPRRKFTLITITFLLNVLLWSALICLITSIYQIASDPKDSNNIAPVVLTSTSAIVTLAYTFFHTVISFKQRIWKHQQRDPSTIKKTSYVAIRIVISLCTLWLITSGWNMILVARRPVCLAQAPELQAWEYGPTCQVSRTNMAFAMIALVASCTLFGVLGAVRRPFEAHLFKHGYEQPRDIYGSPSPSLTPSPPRRTSFASEKRPRVRGMSGSTHRSFTSHYSNTDVETLDLNSSPPPSMIHAPSPVRSYGLGIFTSRFTPPPIPAAYVAPPRTSSLDLPPPVFQPSISHNSLSRPPRISGLVSTSGFVPLSVPAQYSASAWKAVHPNSPPSMRPASRPHSHIPSSAMSYRSRYSRSSVSLTRPHRLSTATPTGSVAWSSRSGSTGPEGRDSPFSGDENTGKRATAAEIANSILDGTPIPGTTAPRTHKGGTHMRTSSAPDTSRGAQEPQDPRYDRKAKGWKPHLPSSSSEDHRKSPSEEDTDTPLTQSVPIKLVKLVHSSSAADFLSRFSPDTSPDDDSVSPRRELEREIDRTTTARHSNPRPLPRSRSADPVRRSLGAGAGAGAGVGAVNPAEAAATMLSRMPQDLRMQKTRRREFDEVKNKPLPRIANL